MNSVAITRGLTIYMEIYHIRRDNAVSLSSASVMIKQTTVVTVELSNFSQYTRRQQLCTMVRLCKHNENKTIFPPEKSTTPETALPRNGDIMKWSLFSPLMPHQPNSLQRNIAAVISMTALCETGTQYGAE